MDKKTKKRSVLKHYVTNIETGEVFDDYLSVMLPRRQYNGFQRGGFIMNSQEALEALAKHGLNGRTCKVLFMVLSKVDYNNYITINQTELAKRLRITRPDFSKEIKKLIEIGLIFKGPKIGVQCSYRLNPNFGWKGKAKEHRKQLLQLVKKEKEKENTNEEEDTRTKSLFPEDK